MCGTYLCSPNRLVLTPGLRSTTLRTSSSSSGVVLLGRPPVPGGCAKLLCSHRRQWIPSNVFRSGNLCMGYLSRYKRRDSKALPCAKPYMQCMLASSSFVYIITSQQTANHTLIITDNRLHTHLSDTAT
jgi:hypothetical protein